MIKALFKFSKVPTDFLVIDTTSSTGDYRDLSPFILFAPPALRFENLWQFTKVYKEHLDDEGEPNLRWYHWNNLGYQSSKAHRYPMGKGRIPEYSYWDGEHLDYIQARKRIYAPEYAKNVIKTDGYKRLLSLYEDGRDIALLDYDAYDHQNLGMTLVDVINNPKRKMGHAFVLIMILTGKFDDCIAPQLPKKGR